VKKKVPKKNLFFFSFLVKKKRSKRKTSFYPDWRVESWFSFLLLLLGGFMGVDIIGRPRPGNRPANSGFLLVLFF